MKQVVVWIVVGLAACGGNKQEVPKGACEFRNLEQRFKTIPASLAICLDDISDEQCGFGPLYDKLDKLRTKDHRFHPKTSCAAVGFAPCGDTALPFAHRPCVADSAPFRSPAAAAGPAYISLDDGLAVILEDGTFHVVAGPRGWVDNLTLAADGSAYATDWNDGKVYVWKLAGVRAELIATLPNGQPTALAVDSNGGTIFVAIGGDVLRFDGKPEKLPASRITIEALALDAEGTLVAAGTGARRFVDGAWRAIELPGDKQYEDTWLLGTGANLVIAVDGSTSFYKLAAGKLAPYLKTIDRVTDRPSSTSAHLIAFRDAAGTIVYDSAGGTLTSERGAPDFTNRAIDDRARVWYFADGGLTIVSLTKDETTTYPIGTLPPLADRKGKSTLLVIGAGPDKLPAREPVRVVERVTGTLLVGDKPLAYTDVEICTSTTYSYKVSPCESRPSRISATTDATGAFSFSNVPIGSYELAFNHGGRWAVGFLTSIDLATPGPSHALGELRFSGN